MKKLFLALGIAGISMFMPAISSAQAANQHFVQLSTAVHCGVSVSASAGTRVDNFNSTTGCYSGVLTTRNTVKIAVPTGGNTINCGFDANVSTSSVSGNSDSYLYGEEITAGSKLELSLSPGLPYYCRAQTSAQIVNVQQAKPYKTPGE